MLNIGVVCDLTWDNFALINNKFKKLNDENYRLHALYGKTLEIFNNCSNKNKLILYRHSSDNLSTLIYNLLKICDIWLIFTNHIEYLTPPSLVIQKCDEFSINYIIISECSRDLDIYSFMTSTDLTFKKTMTNLFLNLETNLKNKLTIEPFNDIDYNINFTKKIYVPINISPELKKKIKESTEKILHLKNEKSIKLLYDKEELKKEKLLKKMNKSYKQMEYSNNRINYYKNNK